MHITTTSPLPSNIRYLLNIKHILATHLSAMLILSQRSRSYCTNSQPSLPFIIRINTSAAAPLTVLLVKFLSASSLATRSTVVLTLPRFECSGLPGGLLSCIGVLGVALPMSRCWTDCLAGRGVSSEVPSVLAWRDCGGLLGS